MLIEREKIAALDICEGFVDVMLSRGKVVVFFDHAFSYALVEKLEHRTEKCEAVFGPIRCD
jgi:hypothetical protein